MLNTCLSCGAYRVDKPIDVDRSEAICPACGHRQPFVRADLLLVGGASGSGKTAVCTRLVGTLAGAVALDSDILWSDDYAADPQRVLDTTAATVDETTAAVAAWIRTARSASPAP